MLFAPYTQTHSSSATWTSLSSYAAEGESSQSGASSSLGIMAGVAATSVGLLGAVTAAFYLRKRKRTAQAEGGRKVAPASEDPFDPPTTTTTPSPVPDMGGADGDQQQQAVPEIPSTRGKRGAKLRPLRATSAGEGESVVTAVTPAVPEVQSVPEIGQVKSRVRAKKLGANKVEPLGEVPTVPAAEESAQSTSSTAQDEVTGAIASIGSVPRAKTANKRRVRLAKKPAADVEDVAKASPTPALLPELGSVSSRPAGPAQGMQPVGQSIFTAPAQGDVEGGGAPPVPSAKTKRRRAKHAPGAQGAGEIEGAPSSVATAPALDQGGVGYGELFQRKEAPNDPSPDRAVAERLVEEDIDQ